MRIEGTRFGEIELDEAKAIELPRGLIGFPAETRFVLLEPSVGRRVAWLQSLSTPALAFPVVDGAAIAIDYPSPSPQVLAHQAALGADDVSVLVIVTTRGEGAPSLVANMLAPIVVDLVTRKAAQVILDPKVYSAASAIALRPAA